MPAQSDAAIAALLNGTVSGATTLALGTNLRTGPPRPHGSGVPLGPVVFCLQTNSAREPYLGTDQDVCTESVQMTIRSKVEAFALGQALALACFDAVHKQVPADFIDTFVVNGPNYIGQDENGSHRWTINVRCRVVRAT